MRPFAKTAARVVWCCALLWVAQGTAVAQQSLSVPRAPREASIAQSMQVEPGATCVSAASLGPQVEAWLGAASLDPDVGIQVRGAPDDARDVAFAVHRGDEVLATRRFAPAPFVCAQLEATLALAIAMALKASLREELLEDLGAEREAPRRGNGLSAQLRVGTGLLPRRSFGGSFAYVREFGDRFGLRSELGVDGARGVGLQGSAGSFDAWLLSGQVAGCALFPLSSDWRARACFGGALGALRASGEGYVGARVDWLTWVAVTNSLALSARLAGRFWLDVPVRVVVPLNEVSFQLLDDTGAPASSRSLPVVGLTVGLATEYRF